MQLLPVDQIEVPSNRQRREFDLEAMQELSQSIEDNGLLHPLVVRREGDRVLLVAGERRLRAIKDIYELGTCIKHAVNPNSDSAERRLVPHGLIPVTDLGELSPLEAREAELEENIRRRDLTVVEIATATSELFDLRVAQAAARGQPAPKVADIAREISATPASKPLSGSVHESVRDHLIIAKHAHRPDVRKATSVREAVKIIRNEEQKEKNAALAKALGTTYSTSSLSLIQGNSLDWLRAAASNQFPIILCDPPYGMNAQDFGDSGRPGADRAHTYDDSPESWAETMSVFCPESFRVAAPQAHAYVFCDIDRFFELRSRMQAAGWTVHRTPLIWHNPGGYRAPWPDRGPQRRYELILFAARGNKPVTKMAGDVLEYARDAQAGHPAQKPVGLLRDLLQRSATPGERVLDPFAGSGSTLEAAFSLQLPCTAIEMDAGHYATALARISALNPAGVF